MKQKEIFTTTGEKLLVFDDVYEFNTAFYFQSFAEKSVYSLSGGSINLKSHHGEENIKSIYSEEDVNAMGIFNHSSYDIFKKEIGTRNVERVWVNLSTYMSKYSFHPDGPVEKKAKTFLYYLNTKWDINWGGETLFCNKYGEVEIAIGFKPNRVIIFDSHIPHKPSQLSADSYPFRYTFVAQFS